jgi:ribosomal protein L37E
MTDRCVVCGKEKLKRKGKYCFKCRFEVRKAYMRTYGAKWRSEHKQKEKQNGNS